MINVEVPHTNQLLYQLFSYDLKGNLAIGRSGPRVSIIYRRVIRLIYFFIHGTTVSVTFVEYVFGGKYDGTCLNKAEAPRKTLQGDLNILSLLMLFSFLRTNCSGE